MSAPAWGVYVHFPYCVHRCTYCDFPLQTPRTIPQARFTDALLTELARREAALGAPAATLYIGGGTPSLWALEHLARVLAALRRRPGLDPGAEVTLEANPGQVGGPWLEAIRGLGINRLSLGAQSFHDGHLRTLTRRHSGREAREAARAIAGAGLWSWSLDLIFGAPGQTLEDWRADLDAALALAPPHLSVYGLTVEPGTLLARDVARGHVVPADEDLSADMLLTARAVLREAGYIHYEVSSYALPGHHAAHNARYWDGSPYLGLGPGAHGYDGADRWRNLARVRRYEEALAAGGLPEAERTRIDPETRAFERIMTGLRRLDTGVDLGPEWPRLGAQARDYAARGLLTLDGTRATLTEAGLLVMDDVLVGFLGR